MNQFSSKTMTGYRIRVIRQSASPIEHALEEGRSVFIGRGESCGIQIKGDSVADIHCLVDVDDENVSIQDWASDAGTIVNGTAIDDKTPIWVGDSIVIGSTTLELIGKPSSQKANSNQASAQAEETREESVGMENLGCDLSEGESTALIDPPPGVEPSLERLSDSFEDTTLEPQSEEPIEDAMVESAVAESTAALCDLVSPVEDHSSDGEELNRDDDGFDDKFCSNHLTAEDLDWDPTTFDDDHVDAEIVQLLKSEIEDLRIQVAERDEQLATMEGHEPSDPQQAAADQGATFAGEFGSTELVGRVEDLLAELAEHDERVSTLQELLQMAEIQNQAEREERNCLETWVGEIEQRIGERESEWQAEQDALRGRLESVAEERDQFQQQLHAAAKRYGEASVGQVDPDETLQKLQKQNAELQTALEDAQKQLVGLNRQIEHQKTEEPESLQNERAELAQEKAASSRMRFQLSKQLQDIEGVSDAKDQPDREFAYKLQTLREHLREIHEEEKIEREQKGESLFGRISNLWKRVDDEY